MSIRTREWSPRSDRPALELSIESGQRHWLAQPMIDARERNYAQPSPPDAARDAVLMAIPALGNAVRAGLSYSGHDREGADYRDLCVVLPEFS